MIKIITDTTSGLPLEKAKELGISVLPQIVIFGEESYRDDTELSTATFLQKLRLASELPKTAAPPPAMYHAIFDQVDGQHATAICIHPSSKVSGTVRSAEVAAQDYPETDIRIVDTQTIAGNLATLVLLAEQWARSGMDVDLIISQLRDLIPRQRIFFLLDTLEYLHKGGRIGGAKALMGEMLQIKPILTMRDGQVEPFEQARTKRRATARLAEIVEEQSGTSDNLHLCVMHVDALEEAELLVVNLKGMMKLTHIPLYELPPAIVVHAGPKALGVGFFT